MIYVIVLLNMFSHTNTHTHTHTHVVSKCEHYQSALPLALSDVLFCDLGMGQDIMQCQPSQLEILQWQEANAYAVSPFCMALFLGTSPFDHNLVKLLGCFTDPSAHHPEHCKSVQRPDSA